MEEKFPVHHKGEPLPKEYETFSRDELRKRLQDFIADLLEHDFQKLCNLIYRHDVKEEKFRQALQYSNIEEQASEIAELVIERELQKVETRKAYRELKNRKNIGPS